MGLFGGGGGGRAYHGGLVAAPHVDPRLEGQEPHVEPQQLRVAGWRGGAMRMNMNFALMRRNRRRGNGRPEPGRRRSGGGRRGST